MDEIIDAVVACAKFAKSDSALAPAWCMGVRFIPIEDNTVTIYGERPIPQGHAAKKLDLKITREGYDYSLGQAYVNFANERLGGGVLNHGFVQEEIGTFESNLLPVLSENPQLKETHLGSSPKVLSVLRFFW